MASEPAAAYRELTPAEREGALILADALGSARARPTLWEEAEAAYHHGEVGMRRRDRRNVNGLCVLGMQRCAHAADPQRVSHCVSLYSLLVELAWKEAAAAGKQEEAGEGIRSAVHPRYLGHVTDEKVERDVPANNAIEA